MLIIILEKRSSSKNVKATNVPSPIVDCQIFRRLVSMFRFLVETQHVFETLRSLPASK